ncbi:MAG: twin-arginine translocase TatA/TatE family subunit [Solirubrobacterales bacterium]|nr:twin-arginine translocase TatA/TatE family subunit [Solirubrobacterales bacterium]MBV9472827.1 twin-arginine translocase TatA/TatE family subunit [Solirubrobacterales bacterium]MBV9838587.1 twin-arginine translocase TatA/TatE family subunit [Solirubrobacterales bacterium]
MGLDNPLHLAFLLIILLLVFGAKRLPELGRSLGSGMRGFKESISGEAGPAQQIEPRDAAPAAAPTALSAPVEHPPVRPVA